MSALPTSVVEQSETWALHDLLEAPSDGSNVIQLPLRRRIDIKPADGLYATSVKDQMDRILAALLIAFLSPVFLAVALIVRCALGPGVIFRQDRVGRNGRIFTILKFRTMRPGPVVDDSVPEAERWDTYKSEEDPRHTPAGKWLRAMSLDELPQLINVIRGEMSLVGPRPELVELVELDDLWDHPRHLVKPGLTGPWQLSDERGNRLRDGLHYDVGYVQEVSASHDAALLIRTAKSIPMRLGR